MFSGLDRGVEGGLAQAYERSLGVDEALRDALLASRSSACRFLRSTAFRCG